MRIKKFDSMNVIPFIDIMLVLLAIVLTFSTFISQGRVDLTLPSSKTSVKKNKSKSIELCIDAKGRVSVDAKKVSFESLKVALQQYSTNTKISLKADENTPFKTFVRVVDTLKELQLNKIYIVTKIER